MLSRFQGNLLIEICFVDNLAIIFRHLMIRNTKEGFHYGPEKAFKIITTRISYKSYDGDLVSDGVYASVTTSVVVPLVIMKGPAATSTQDGLAGLLKVTEATMANYPDLVEDDIEEKGECGGGYVDRFLVEEGIVP